MKPQDVLSLRQHSAAEVFCFSYLEKLCRQSPSCCSFQLKYTFHKILLPCFKKAMNLTEVRIVLPSKGFRKMSHVELRKYVLLLVLCYSTQQQWQGRKLLLPTLFYYQVEYCIIMWSGLRSLLRVVDYIIFEKCNG